MSNNPQQGVLRIYKAFGYSMAGLRAAFVGEAAFRQEVVLALIILVAIIFIPISYLAKALIFASVMLVLITELLNSAIEAVVDRISMEKHPLAKQAKDIGSAAVFLSLVNLVVICAMARLL